jgi:hypothetical protein
MAAAAAAVTPSALADPPGASLTLRAQGRGVQIYACDAAPDQPGVYAWRLKAPRADLYGADGRMVGRHSAGPSWEGLDGGKVVGALLAKAPSPDPSAIDWLLLAAKSVNGVGVLGKTRYIQRTQTVGGRAPEQGCSPASRGALTQVPYTATYEFYTAP